MKEWAGHTDGGWETVRKSYGVIFQAGGWRWSFRGQQRIKWSSLTGWEALNFTIIAAGKVRKDSRPVTWHSLVYPSSDNTSLILKHCSLCAQQEATKSDQIRAADSTHHTGDKGQAHSHLQALPNTVSLKWRCSPNSSGWSSSPTTRLGSLAGPWSSAKADGVKNQTLTPYTLAPPSAFSFNHGRWVWLSSSREKETEELP